MLTQRASHAGRQLFGKVPEINLQQLLANAMRGDPIRPGAPRFSLLASLLEDNPTPKAYTAMALRMHAYMLQAGLTAARDEGPIDRSAQPVLVPSEEEPQAAPAPTMPEPAGEEGETDDFSDFQQQSMMQPNQELETAMKNTIEAEEGRRAGVYLDHLGNRTIGVGFNLERDDAEQLLSSVGADFAAILDGSQQLTEEQIDQLYQITFQEAVEAAGRVVPGFEELSEDQQHVLVDMAFQLGERGLSKFDKMLTAIKAGDFQTAAMELLDSRYAKQVPSRARRNADRLKQEAV